MIVIIFGPHGSGKGTQAKMVADTYGLTRISTGELFRESIGSGSALGKKVRQYVEKSVYVPDDLVNQVVANKITESRQKGFVFDGYPRTADQAEYLEKVLRDNNLSIDLVISLNVPDEELIRRLGSRLTCSKCGAGYNLVTNPPKKAGICDACGGKLYQRKDDSAEGMKSRMNEYRTKAEPLADYYLAQGKLIDVDGNKSPGQVFKDIKNLLDKLV